MNLKIFQVHRLVVVDENDCVIGIISLSDLLQYLVLRPQGEAVRSLRTVIESEIESANSDHDSALGLSNTLTDNNDNSTLNAVEMGDEVTVNGDHELDTSEPNFEKDLAASILKVHDAPLPCDQQDDGPSSIELAQDVTDYEDTLSFSEENDQNFASIYEIN